MFIAYYTGKNWLANPHHFVPDLFGWVRLFLYTTVSRLPDRPLDDQKGFGWYIATIHERNNMGIFDDAFNNGEGGKMGQAFSDPDFGGKYPILHAYMTRLEDDAGKKRITSTLMIFAEDGVAKAALRERNHDLTLWMTSSSILDLFEALEEGLKKRPIEWRKNKEQKGGWRK
jgi:hypothetical protein